MLSLRPVTLIVIGVPSVWMAMLAIPPVALPSDSPGIRRFQVEIVPGMTVSQTFTMTADGLHAIAVAPAIAGRPIDGDLQLELYDVTDGVKLVRAVTVSAVVMMNAPTYRLDFQPIAESEDRIFRLDLRAASDRPAAGVALWATKGRRYAGGTMFVNERERWADLAFWAFAPAGRSSWQRLSERLPGDGAVSRGHLILALLATCWILFGILVATLSPDARRS